MFPLNWDRLYLLFSQELRARIGVPFARQLFIGILEAVDGRNPAPPKKPWGDASPVNTNKEWFAMISKWCEMDFVHPQYRGWLPPQRPAPVSPLPGQGWPPCQFRWPKCRRCWVLGAGRWVVEDPAALLGNIKLGTLAVLLVGGWWVLVGAPF